MGTTSNKRPDQELVELQALLTGPTVDTPHNEPDPEARKSFIARRMEQREAYGQFVAAQDIFDPMGNTLAFAAGHPVPIEHVEKWLLEDAGLVTRVATPEEARKVVRPAPIGPAALLGSSPSEQSAVSGTAEPAPAKAGDKATTANRKEG